MMQQSLQFTAKLDPESAMQVQRALEAVAGVSRVVTTSAGNRVSVFYDEGRTSSQELVARLARAGYTARVPRHHGAEGGCGG